MTTNSTSGYRLVSAMEHRLTERKLAARWRQCISLAAEHRAGAHPEWRDRGQKVRTAAAKAAPVSYWHTRGVMGEL